MAEVRTAPDGGVQVATEGQTSLGPGGSQEGPVGTARTGNVAPAAKGPDPVAGPIGAVRAVAGAARAAVPLEAGVVVAQAHREVKNVV